MPIRELSVEIPNQAGQLARITAAIASAKVNLLGLAASSDGRVGWVRIMVDNPAAAEEALLSAGYEVEAQDALGVLVGNQPGTLHQVLSLLQDNKVSIDYIYNCVQVQDGLVMTVIGVHQPAKAGDILAAAGIQVANSN